MQHASTGCTHQLLQLSGIFQVRPDSFQKILPGNTDTFGHAPAKEKFSVVLVTPRGLLVAPQPDKDFSGGARPTLFVMIIAPGGAFFN